MRLEIEKLIEKLQRWFSKTLQSEGKALNEKLEEMDLVVRKSKEKVHHKLKQAYLDPIQEFQTHQSSIEFQLLKQAWIEVDDYATEVQSVLGPGFTWLDGVTYKDWKS